MVIMFALTSGDMISLFAMEWSEYNIVYAVSRMLFFFSCMLELLCISVGSMRTTIPILLEKPLNHNRPYRAMQNALKSSFVVFIVSGITMLVTFWL